MGTQVVTCDDHVWPSQVHELLIPIPRQECQLFGGELDFTFLDQFTISFQVLLDALIATLRQLLVK